MPKNKVEVALILVTIFFSALAIYILDYNPSHNLTLFIIFWIIAFASVCGYSYLRYRRKRVSKQQASVTPKVSSGVLNPY
jgi:uncharacterized membrane protein